VNDTTCVAKREAHMSDGAPAAPSLAAPLSPASAEAAPSVPLAALPPSATAVSAPESDVSSTVPALPALLASATLASSFCETEPHPATQNKIQKTALARCEMFDTC
jgi:hypothetical protein